MATIKYRDTEKEKQLLSILIKTQRPDKTEILRRLSPESFSTMVAREVFILIKNYDEKYLAPLNKQIAISLTDKLVGNKKGKVKNLIISLGKMKINSKLIQHLLEEVLHFESCRNVHDMITTAVDVFKQNRDPELVKDFLMDQITQANIREQEDIQVLDLKIDFDRMYSKLLREKKEGKTNMGILTGIDKRLDEEISGISPGELIVIVGIPAGGKSLMMQDMACFQAVELEKKIAYFSNEMIPDAVANRMHSRISEVRHNKFRRPARMRKVDFSKWKISFEELNENRIKIFGMTGNNCSSAACSAKLKEVGYKPDIIYLDHLNNMIPNALSGREIVGDNFAATSQVILRECKSFAVSFKAGVVAAGHLKPEAEEKLVVAYSDIALNKQALSMHPDVLIAIVMTPDMRRLPVPRARLQLLKVREGKTREYIEVIPDFGIIRINNPRKKKSKKKRKR